MKKIAALLAILLVLGMSGFGCGEEDIYTDKVGVIIDAQMKEAYDNETITAETFDWDNIERIEYFCWFENLNKGSVTLYLKRTGWRRVEQAIAHLETLDFVESAFSFPIGFIETGAPSQTVTGDHHASASIGIIETGPSV